ncbi:MAG TPA: hypothetical protein VJI73_01615 [Candidatus Paceibacterota bacterium]
MKESQNVKVVVFVPETHSDAVRKAVGDADAGKLGNYSHCSFSSKGQGRFLPLDGAAPSTGEVGTAELVDEERIEFACDKAILAEVVITMKRAHPYEEVAYDIYQLLD